VIRVRHTVPRSPFWYTVPRSPFRQTVPRSPFRYTVPRSPFRHTVPSGTPFLEASSGTPFPGVLSDTSFLGALSGIPADRLTHDLTASMLSALLLVSFRTGPRLVILSKRTPEMNNVVGRASAAKPGVRYQINAR
jgi:hypothetical protein